MSVEPVRVYFVASLRSGNRSIEAWALNPDSELCVHQEIPFPGDAAMPGWVITHRATGRTVDAWVAQFTSREDALAFTAVLEPLAEWSKLRCDRIEDGPKGWTADYSSAVQIRIRKALADFTPPNSETAEAAA